MQATNNATGNTNLNFSLRAASSTAGTTGSVIVHGDVSLQSEWELHGGAVIQNSGQDEVKSYGAAGLETTVAPALITTPMTMFLVGKVDALTGASQFFTAARDNALTSPQITVNAATSFRFDGGSALDSATPDTDAHLHTVRFNGDSTSEYGVSGLSVVTGNAGSESYQFGTLFTNAGGTSTLTGSVARHIIFDQQLNDADNKLIQERLLIQHRISS